MSSGYFPLDSEYDKWGKVVSMAVAQLGEVSREAHDICRDLNGEDAFSDGQYVGELDDAIAKLTGLLRRDK